MLLVAADDYPGVVGGVHARQVRVVTPAVDAAVVDEAERPLLDGVVDCAPDVDLGESLALLDQLVRLLAKDLSCAIFSCHRVSVDVSDGKSGVRKLGGRKLAGLVAVLADAEYVGDYNVRAGDLLDQLRDLLVVDILDVFLA